MWCKCLLCVVVSIAAEPREPLSPAGRWQIQGVATDGSTWRGDMLLALADDGALSGHIDWSAEGAAGREYVGGTYDATKRVIKLHGERLENARGLALGSYAAALSRDASRLEQGRWADNAELGQWAAVRQRAVGEGTTGFLRKQLKLADGDAAEYVVFVPHKYNGKKPFPVILFLHGSGETRGGEAQPVEVGIGPYIKAHERAFPFIVVFPQAAVRVWRKPQNTAIALGALDKTMGEYNIDARRVYLSGLSMGGTGTWDFAAADPTRWAAIVPICGRANPIDAEKIKDLPCTVFHGAADDVVPVAESRKMVAALQLAGGHPQYVEFPRLKHASWDQAYATAGLWKWLAEQKRSE